MGAGGHGKVVAETAAGRFLNRIAFLDDRFPSLNRTLNYPVLGTWGDARKFLPDYKQLVVALGDNARRVKLLHHYQAAGFKLPVIVHPSANVSPSSFIGRGSVVFAGAVINANAALGLGCIVNTGAIIEHDCTIESGVHIAPGALLAGNVTVGKNSWIGIGAMVVQGKTVASGVTVGAGSVVLDCVPADVMVVGTPAKIIEKSVIVHDL